MQLFKKNKFLSPARKEALGCVIPFGLIFAMAGLAFLWMAVLAPSIKASKAAHWNETPCQVLKSEVIRHDSDDSTTFEAKISFRYEVKGQSYSSEHPDCSGIDGSSDRSESQNLCARYPAGLQTRCLVNPTDPKEAVLEAVAARGFSYWFAIPFASAFIFIGLSVLFLGISGLRKHRGIATAAKNPPPGGVTLNPRPQRRVEVGGIFFVCGFWNGITGLFVLIWLVETCSGRMSGVKSLLMGLFLTPFVGIGIGILRKFLQSLAKLRVTTVEIKLPALQWRQGERIALEWRCLDKNISRIQFRLTATEQATYQQGTNTTTDNAEVAQLILHEEKGQLRRGSLDFTVPRGLMPSFTLRSNALLWQLEVQAHAASGEELPADSYEIDILPEEAP